MSDTWLLASLALTDGGKGATLREIIAAVDHLDHSILSVDELRHGLALLTQACYVIEKEGRIFLAGDAKTFQTNYQRQYKTDFKLLESAKDFLGVPETGVLNSDALTNQYHYDGLTDEIIQKACREYLSGDHAEKPS